MVKERLVPERILRITLAELTVVRITCEQCGAISEVTPERLAEDGKLLCPGCCRDLKDRPNIAAHLKYFANGLVGLKKAQADKENKIAFHLSIVLPE